MKTWISNSGQIELQMTIEQAQSVSHQGRCDEDVECLVVMLEIKKQLDNIDNKLMAKVLSEFGVWDDVELKNNHDNRLRLVWIAGGDIADALIQ